MIIYFLNKIKYANKNINLMENNSQNTLESNNINNNNNPNQNNHELLTERLIQELNRSNNEEALGLIRRVVEIRENSLRYQILDFEDSLFDLIISNESFVHSTIILLIISGLFYLELSKLSKIQNFSVKHLESEELWYLYSLGFFMVIISLWNVYLLFFKIFSFFDSFRNFRKDKLNDFTSGDVLFFNPFYINLMIIHYNKSYMATVFDFYIILTVSLAFSINFFFTNYYHNYLKKQITSISNIHLTRTKIIYLRIKIFFMFLIGMNVMTSYFISYVTEFSDFYFAYILQIKSLYMILKQISLWYENETSYKQLDNYYATNEEYYLKTQFNKTIIKIVTSTILAQVLFFGNFLFYREGSYMFFVPNSLICFSSCMAIYKVFKKYDEIKTFFDRLDLFFPQINLNDSEHECTICTEILTKARKLSCNHYFHLICLSKWIENGKKNCPLCRKEINCEQENREPSRRREYRFEFNFVSRFLSWLPQITIRVRSFH